MRCSLSRRAAHKAACMPNDCSFAEYDCLFAKLEFIAETEGPTRRDHRATLHFFVEVKVVLVQESGKEIGESTAVKVLINRTSRLPHLSEEPEVRHDRVLHPQSFFVCWFSAHVSPFNRTGEFRIQLEIVLPRRFRLA